MAKKGNNGGGKGGGGGDNGGDGGINEIRGNRKDNTLLGTFGDDRILAGAGDDIIYADGDIESDVGGNDFVWAEDGDDLVFGEAGNDELFGLNGNDTIFGGSGQDEVIGGNGADSLDGGAGDDFLQGGLGMDMIIGGTGHDIAAYDDVGGYGDPDHGIVLTSNGVSGSYSVTYDNSSGTSDIDTVEEVEEVWGSNFDDQMTGSSDGTKMIADRFFGLQGADTIDGGAGADVLFGGLDDDVLTGGSGADTFVFLRRADGIVKPDNYEELTDPPPLDAYEDAGTGDGIDIITDFQDDEFTKDKLLFLSNEHFSIEDFHFGYVDATETEDAYTWITYKAEPDLLGPSEVRILNQNLSKEDLVDNIVIQIDADFAFEF